MYYSDFRWRTCSACQSRWCAYIRVLKDMCIVWARGHYSRCFGGYGRKWGGIVWVKEGDSARGYVTVCIYIHLYAGLSACAVFKIDNILFSLRTMNGWWQNGVIHYCYMLCCCCCGANAMLEPAVRRTSAIWICVRQTLSLRERPRWGGWVVCGWCVCGVGNASAVKFGRFRRVVRLVAGKV